MAATRLRTFEAADDLRKLSPLRRICAKAASIGGATMSNITGGCHCGAIRYQVEGELIVHALCHCSDCRRHAGAPVVGWTMYARGCGQGDEGAAQGLRIHPSMAAATSAPTAARGSSTSMRTSCPGIIDIQSATYDDPDAVPAMVHIQTAERLHWMERAHELPSFERYPPQTCRCSASSSRIEPRRRTRIALSNFSPNSASSSAARSLTAQ